MALAAVVQPEGTSAPLEERGPGPCGVREAVPGSPVCLTGGCMWFIVIK